jgi:hypothetical protein
MRIHRIAIPKSKLVAIPPTERVFFIQLGHICNELSFFNKLLIFTSNQAGEGLDRKTMTTQSLIVARVFIGKVFEAWEMLKRDFFRSKLSKELEPSLSDDGKAALDQLKKYFGGSNLLATIRNKFSFHYFSKIIEKSFSAFGDDKVFELYLAKNYANTLHYFSEEIVSTGMLDKTGKSTQQEAMDQLVGDLVDVSGKITDFTGHALAAIFERNLGQSWDEFETDSIDVETESDLEEFKIPFFFE